MTPDQMRHKLKYCTKYKNSMKWCRKVDSMPESQVIAVFLRLQASGEIFKKKFKIPVDFF